VLILKYFCHNSSRRRLSIISVLTTGVRRTFIPIIAEVNYWSSTIWTSIVTLFNPSFYARRVEIMSLITSQLRYHIFWFVIHQTYYAIAFVLEPCWIVLSPAKTCQNHWNLSLTNST
jgi:hypothetical protein